MDIQHALGGNYMTIAVNQWGNSLAIRIPQSITKSFNLEKGSELVMKVEGNQIILQPVQKKFTAEFAIQDMEGKVPPSEIFPEDGPEGDEMI
ncbi:antitoxin MazE [Alkalihalobacillus xiaoxiensis]|uniref:Antitoxin MazE n=1 Tax=Shouchella xiaoxiensis TaxID=766895 RepID=A0ABS2SWQ3_9BACI|nr:AbrB/MazE/SpoVT family DNA-binding domain-containing protein [Shouchella xiaoxiensis]MBM7839961.1 antitoxin MazE [Shouchella xiaoxiensis]